MEHYDILIIGGGAAGIAAAKTCAGAKVLLVDRKKQLGGVLLQCAHHGFGNNKSGIEYAADLLKDFPETVTLALDTTVLSVSADKKAQKCPVLRSLNHSVKRQGIIAAPHQRFRCRFLCLLLRSWGN